MIPLHTRCIGHFPFSRTCGAPPNIVVITRVERLCPEGCIREVKFGSRTEPLYLFLHYCIACEWKSSHSHGLRTTLVWVAGDRPQSTDSHGTRPSPPSDRSQYIRPQSLDNFMGRLQRVLQAASRRKLVIGARNGGDGCEVPTENALAVSPDSDRTRNETSDRSASATRGRSARPESQAKATLKRRITARCRLRAWFATCWKEPGPVTACFATRIHATGRISALEEKSEYGFTRSEGQTPSFQDYQGHRKSNNGSDSQIHKVRAYME